LKINDLVRIKTNPGLGGNNPDCKGLGVIMDCLEMDDGFYEYEILFADGIIEWYSDILIEAIQK